MRKTTEESTQFLNEVMTLAGAVTDSERILFVISAMLNKIREDQRRKFIGYFIVRDSSYQTAFEKIGKAVDEFIELERKPALERAKESSSKICRALRSIHEPTLENLESLVDERGARVLSTEELFAVKKVGLEECNKIKHLVHTDSSHNFKKEYDIMCQDSAIYKALTSDSVATTKEGLQMHARKKDEQRISNLSRDILALVDSKKAIS